MPKPLFTIVTVTYNSGNWVNQAIESVLASGFINFEYLICDDCSSDNTWEIIQSFKDLRIKTFRHSNNIGEYNNRNFALQNAQGQYLLFVDGDDTLYQDTLNKLAGYIDLFPEAGSVWGVHENGFDFSKFPILLSSKDIIQWIYLANIRVAQLGFAETLFKIDLLKRVGGFPTKYISGDTQIKKICALEAPVLLVPPGLVYWRISDGQASARLSLNYNGFKNNVAIDNEILQRLLLKNIDVPIKQIEENIRTRNIKLLFKNTFLKGKIKDGIRLFRQLDFATTDLKYLFKKGNYDYFYQLKKEPAYGIGDIKHI